MARWQGFYDELSSTRYPALLAYAVALTGQRATAEDLVQEALVRTFSMPRRLHSMQHAEYYVRRAIATLFIDDKRREALFLRTQARMVSGEAEPARAVEVDERDAVTAALLTLPPRMRACVVLRYYDDYTMRQVADTLGIAIGSVKRYLHDASELLRATLGADEDKQTMWVEPASRSKGGY